MNLPVQENTAPSLGIRILEARLRKYTGVPNSEHRTMHFPVVGTGLANSALLAFGNLLGWLVRLKIRI